MCMMSAQFVFLMGGGVLLLQSSYPLLSPLHRSDDDELKPPLRGGELEASTPSFLIFCLVSHDYLDTEEEKTRHRYLGDDYTFDDVHGWIAHHY